MTPASAPPEPAPPLLGDDAPRARLGDRSLFPDLADPIYLNHAAISPPSAAVRRAVARVVDDYARRGVGAVGDWVAQHDALRGKLARLIGAGPGDIAFVPNTSRGITDVALCIPWRPGDRVVLFEGEFPANVTPWQRAADRHDLDLVWLSPEPFVRSLDEGLATLAATLDAGPVRVVATSAVRFQTGFRMPVEAMAERCRSAGASLFVDAIQGLGMVPSETFVRAGVDYLACGGHKWLMGLEGIGFLYARPERAAELRPDVAGWLSHEEPLRFLFEGAGHLRHDRPIRQRVDLVEGGALNHVGAAALEASVDLILGLGVARVFGHVQRHLDQLEHLLVERGFTSARSNRPDGRSGSLCVRPPEGVDLLALHRSLRAAGVSCTTPDGWLRFSPHWPNDPDRELPPLTDALDHALRAA
ncbi:MAG TPA: aminotransferase class V-fold PLP-dependent enzyme [Polyangiaceae bacterium LLY-WYZ-14_1]|nr:aminotransferase class V-fold PLP-dependent enzyme [Polyangiaceae bacterium LLY-WYZ-14_1]